MAKRFFVTPEDIRGDKALLRGREAHHAARVLRMKVGDPLVLFDGEGHEYQGLIREILKGEVAVSLKEKRESPPEGVRITVACSLPKRLRMERVIEKLTEAGVETILPLATERTVPQIRREKEETKCRRWKQIATEAAKQCGASRLPEISGLLSLAEVLKQGASYDLALFLDPRGRGLREILDGKRASRVIVLVGPEGGWSEEEREAATGAEWKPVSLGKRILKVDTACLAIVSVLHYALDS